MLMMLILLMAANEYLLTYIVFLNQVGPGWEVPMSVMISLQWLKLGSIIFVAVIIFFFYKIAKRKTDMHIISKLLLLMQFTLLVLSWIVVMSTNAFDGQFYHPEQLTPLVFWAAIVLNTILLAASIVSLKKHPL